MSENAFGWSDLLLLRLLLLRLVLWAQQIVQVQFQPDARAG